MKQKKHTITQLSAQEERAVRDLCFTAICKNTHVTHSYDFGNRPQYEAQKAITGIFTWALYKRRFNVGHETRCTLRDNWWKFLRFLKEYGISKPKELNGQTLINFVTWLKNSDGASYTSSASTYRLLSPYFTKMSKHPDISSDFCPVRNAFPKSSKLQMANPGYDEIELKEIGRAASKAMRETIQKLSANYTYQWLGKSPPTEDVAPISEKGGYSLWNSLEYKIWWWVNKCECQHLSSHELSKIPQGQVFIGSFKGGMREVRAFYENISSEPHYRSKYLNSECPIKYTTPWKKFDYLHWYWENEINSVPHDLKGLRAAFPKFATAICEHFGGRISEFYGSIGIYKWITTLDLIPLYILLLIRTQLNPSTIQRLTIDCLAEDPTNSSRAFLEWEKFRSSKKGKTIPSNREEDLWPAMLVKKIITITQQIRKPNQRELWIANSNVRKRSEAIKKSGFSRGMQAFSSKYNLKHSCGKPLSLQAKLIRPTMAWQEYFRTNDIKYLQTILGHAKLQTTADYLRRVGDPVFKMRRGIHTGALFLKLTDNPQEDSPFYFDVFLNHCKDPQHSPIAGQKKGVNCSAGHEVCLGCANLVVTPEDIKKYYCYVRYYQNLRNHDLITEEELNSYIEEKIFMWNHYILPRFPAKLVKSIQIEATLNPISAWSMNA